MRYAFSLRILLLVFIILILSTAPFIFLLSHLHKKGIHKSVEENLQSLSHILTKQLERFMQIEHPKLTQDYLLDLIAHSEVQTITIYRKDGKATFSSNPLNIGRYLPQTHPICKSCHLPSPPRKTNTWKDPEKPEVLSFLSVVRNQKKCYTCHGSNAHIIGFLRIDLPMMTINKETRRSLFTLLMVALWMILSSGIVLVITLRKRIIQPVETLAIYAQQLKTQADRVMPAILRRQRLFENLAHQIQDTTQALHEQEAFLKAILNSLEEQIVVIDENQHILLANQSFYDKTPEDKRGPYCRREDGGCLALEALKEEKPLQTFIEEGKHRFLFYAIPLFFKGKKVVLEVRQDISHVQQLAQSERLATLGLLASGVAHQINSPLNVLLTNLEMLRREGKLSDRMWRRVSHACNRLEELGKRMLLLATSQGERSTWVDLSHFSRRVLHFVEPLCQQQKIKMDREIKTDGMKIKTDPEQLEQVLINLLVNAVQAMPKGGKLTFKSSYQKDEVIFVIGDTGKGIRKEDLPHIFEPTFSTKGSQGTGFGLFLVKHFLQNLGGNIHVTTSSKGTIFTVTLGLDHAGTSHLH